ncbi:MFS transporter [Streptomyces sp. NPDC086777]|uniref:MFS transporter n=1 Tax=Streptomyces sp. NPDC086777 TaxID=3154866 RepID=UPI00344D5389
MPPPHCAFGASRSQAAWVTSAFILPTAILELNFGVVGDLFGRKRLLVLGGFVPAVGELLNATSQNITMLWIGQALAGIGAAALFPSSLAVVAAATPEEKDRAKAVSTWALSISLASAVGPLSSGVPATVADFRWAFAPPVVLGIAVGISCWAPVTDSRAPGGRALDRPGQISIRRPHRPAVGHHRGRRPRLEQPRHRLRPRPRRRGPGGLRDGGAAPPRRCSTWSC